MMGTTYAYVSYRALQTGYISRYVSHWALDTCHSGRYIRVSLGANLFYYLPTLFTIFGVAAWSCQIQGSAGCSLDWTRVRYPKKILKAAAGADPQRDPGVRTLFWVPTMIFIKSSPPDEPSRKIQDFLGSMPPGPPSGPPTFRNSGFAPALR